MKKLHFLILLFSLGANFPSVAQVFDKYQKLISEAEEHYANEEYTISAEKFDEALNLLGKNADVVDRYNAASSFALAGNTDKAFEQLLIMEKELKYQDDDIIDDPDFESLYTDPRWNKLVTKVQVKKAKAEKNLDKELKAKLDSIHVLDQKYRMQLHYIWKGEADVDENSEKFRAIVKQMNVQDSINLIAVKSILDERGWLGKEVVGDQGNSALFLVIQHADLDSQLKYLPMLRKAVKKDNADPSDLALLEDRVALKQGKKQIYGSQMAKDEVTGEYYVSPLIDPENVDKRRRSVGLLPLAQYSEFWDFTWTVEKHNAKMAELEAREKDKEN